MKKADNFDASKWLVENKITTQSRLTKEAKDPDSAVSQEARNMFYDAVAKVMEDLYQADIVDDDVIDAYLGTEGGLLGDAIEAYLHSEDEDEDLDESRLNENKNLGPDDFKTFKWKDQPANPKARLEDLENEDTLSKEDFWKSDIIGNDDSTPLYGSENNGVWTFSWDVGEISGFIEGEDFTLSNLNENAGLASKIAQLPDFNTAENTEKATLVVGKYAVVRYDDREYEDGQDMYVVWDNTRDQDEIGSYDDVPEFESIYPNEVATWLEQNA